MSLYNKAIRDHIPRIIEENGQKPQIIQLNDEDFLQALKRKLQEEVKEFLDDESISELADIIEVIYAIADLKGITKEQLEEIRIQKCNKNGAFKKKLFLISVDE